MADKKITQLTDLGTALSGVDLFHVVDDPSGTPINKSVSAANIFNFIPTWLGLAQSSQTITADGSSATAIDVLTAVTEVNATSATHAGALADGTAGQIKMILNTSTGGTNNVVITPANLAGGSTITLNAPGESVVCIFKASKWYVIGGHNFAVA
tara:strand:+ start:141 stop:602 length:462 start_codon:yes stop_codon:yes gene_type:complete